MSSYVTEGSGGYSEVDRHYTEISEEDKAILDGWVNDYGYFQTPQSWRINKALRNHEQFGIPLDQAILDQHDSWSFLSEEMQQTRIDKIKQTIRTMDKNMKPLDKDINVVRMTTGKWLLSMLQSFGLDKDGWDSVSSDQLHNSVRPYIDELNKFLSENDATYYDQTFQSATYNTSLSDSAFVDWHHPVRIEYVGTKGTKAMFSPTGEESEIVFDRKSGLKIEGFSWDPMKQELVVHARTTKK